MDNEKEKHTNGYIQDRGDQSMGILSNGDGNPSRCNVKHNDCNMKETS